MSQEFNGVRYYPCHGGYYLDRTGRRRMHRDVWAFYNGHIPSGYHVHHIDGNPANNAIENLICVPAGVHTAIHNTGRDRRSDHLRSQTEKQCVNCGRMFMGMKHAKCCGKACAMSRWEKANRPHVNAQKRRRYAESTERI